MIGNPQFIEPDPVVDVEAWMTDGYSRLSGAGYEIIAHRCHMIAMNDNTNVSMTIAHAINGHDLHISCHPDGEIEIDIGPNYYNYRTDSWGDLWVGRGLK